MDRRSRRFTLRGIALLGALVATALHPVPGGTAATTSTAVGTATTSAAGSAETIVAGARTDNGETVTSAMIAGSPSLPQHTLWHEAAAMLPTRVFFPEDFDETQPHTLVVALHGYGSSAEAFGRVADRLVANGFVVAVPQAPYAFLVEGRIGFDWTLFHVGDDELADRAALPLVREYLPAVARDISSRYPIEDVYVLGFSQGAVLALATAIANHDLYAGAISFGLPDYRPGWLPADALALGRGIEILLMHGRQDARAPFAASEAARDHLSTAGYEVTLHGFTGGHAVPDEQLDYVSRWVRARESPSR